MDANGAVEGWDNEFHNYTYSSNSCDAVCGHYTQVAWANTLRIGCGTASCPSFTIAPKYGAGDVWVCSYDVSFPYFYG